MLSHDSAALNGHFASTSRKLVNSNFVQGMSAHHWISEVNFSLILHW